MTAMTSEKAIQSAIPIPSIFPALFRSCIKQIQYGAPKPRAYQQPPFSVMLKIII